MRVKFLFAALRWVPAFAIVCVSWHLSSLPRIEMMPSFWNADKLVHTVCFAGLAFWAAFGAKAHALRSSWIPALLVSAYGIIDEVHQSFTPGRSSSVPDWCADTLGGIIGSLAFVAALSVLSAIRSGSAKSGKSGG